MLVLLGEALVDPAEVRAVARWGADHVAILRCGAHVSTHTVLAPAELIAFAALSAPAPARVVHPLALALLEAERANGLTGTTEDWQRANLAYTAWREADCPIWAEAEAEDAPSDTELIARQARRLAGLGDEAKRLGDAIAAARRIMFCVGGPLNDNALGFTAEQRKVFHAIDDALSGVDSQDDPG